MLSRNDRKICIAFRRRAARVAGAANWRFIPQATSLQSQTGTRRIRHAATLRSQRSSAPIAKLRKRVLASRVRNRRTVLRPTSRGAFFSAFPSCLLWLFCFARQLSGRNRRRRGRRRNARCGGRLLRRINKSHKCHLLFLRRPAIRSLRVGG